MIQAISGLNQAQFKPVQFNQQKQIIAELALQELPQIKAPINLQRTYALAFCKNNHPSISFKGSIDVQDSELTPTVRKTLCMPLKQSSWLFRVGLVKSLDAIMEGFSDKLDPEKKPPQKPVKFYIYGCADGHETYSIIMYLIKQYGSLEEAKKRVEIHSIDISSPGLEMAKSKNLDVELKDFDNLNELKQNIELNLISDDENIDFKKPGKIKIKDSILKYANFQEGQILEDFKSDGKFNEEEPVAVFFRNALTYVKPEEASPFINNLYSKLPEGSFFCMGGYELSPSGQSQYSEVSSIFDPVLSTKHLNKKNLKEKYFSFRKPYKSDLIS